MARYKKIRSIVGKILVTDLGFTREQIDGSPIGRYIKPVEISIADIIQDIQECSTSDQLVNVLWETHDLIYSRMRYDLIHDITLQVCAIMRMNGREVDEQDEKNVDDILRTYADFEHVLIR